MRNPLKYVILAMAYVIGSSSALADIMTYHNDRFDIKGRVPIEFIAMHAPENGDGREFRSTINSGRVIIAGSYNLYDSFSEFRKESKRLYVEDGADITLETGGDDWFVLSGFHRGQIFYTRVEQGRNCDGEVVLASMYIEYNPVDRSTYDDQIGGLAKGLQAGSC